MEQSHELSLVTLPVSRAHPARAIHCTTADGGHLTLRPLLLGDAEQLEEATRESLPELRAFMPWAHQEPSLVAQLERRRATEADYFAGRDMAMGLFLPDGRLAVGCGLHFRVPLNPNGVECGYWTRTRHARQGMATLALQIMTLYAFDKLGCDRVQVMHHEQNVASQGVIEKCGFQREGSLRNATAAPSAALLGGGFVPTRRSLMWGLIDTDLPELLWVGALRPRLRYVNMAGHTL